MWACAALVDRTSGRIAADVLEKGYDPDLGSFKAAYDLPEMDAATLQVGLSGLLRPDDPRFISTVKGVERVLRTGPTVRRYCFDDGLPGREAGSTCARVAGGELCPAGMREEARLLLDEMCALAGPLGLLAEQYDAATGGRWGITRSCTRTWR